MDLVFRTLQKLSKDKQLLETIRVVTDDLTESLITDENREDYIRVLNFHEDLKDLAETFDHSNY